MAGIPAPSAINIAGVEGKALGLAGISPRPPALGKLSPGLKGAQGPSPLRKLIGQAAAQGATPKPPSTAASEMHVDRLSLETPGGRTLVRPRLTRHLTPAMPQLDARRDAHRGLEKEGRVTTLSCAWSTCSRRIVRTRGYVRMHVVVVLVLMAPSTWARLHYVRAVDLT